MLMLECLEHTSIELWFFYGTMRFSGTPLLARKSFLSQSEVQFNSLPKSETSLTLQSESSKRCSLTNLPH